MRQVFGIDKYFSRLRGPLILHSSGIDRKILMSGPGIANSMAA